MVILKKNVLLNLLLKNRQLSASGLAQGLSVDTSVLVSDQTV